MFMALFGIIGFAMLLGSGQPHVQYAGTFLGAMGIYPCIPNTISWTANNVEGVYKRGISLGFVIGWGNLNGKCPKRRWISCRDAEAASQELFLPISTAPKTSHASSRVMRSCWHTRLSFCWAEAFSSICCSVGRMLSVEKANGIIGSKERQRKRLTSWVIRDRISSTRCEHWENLSFLYLPHSNSMGMWSGQRGDGGMESMESMDNKSKRTIYWTWNIHFTRHRRNN